MIIPIRLTESHGATMGTVSTKTFRAVHGNVVIATVRAGWKGMYSRLDHAGPGRCDPDWVARPGR